MRFLYYYIFALTLSLVACKDNPSTEVPAGKKVSLVEVAQSDKHNEVRIRQFINIVPGTTYSPDLVDDDVKSLYESGLVEDVSVRTEPDEEMIKIIYEITPKHISWGPPILIVGNMAYSDPRITELMNIDEGNLSDLVDLAFCQEKAQIIEEFYHSNGYPDAEITVENGPDLSLHWTGYVFVINEGLAEN